MDILYQLSSQKRDRTEDSNKMIAENCSLQSKENGKTN